MVRFWPMDISFRMKSLVVRACLLSTLLAGLQCFVVKKGEMNKLNHLLRLAMAGRTTEKIFKKDQLVMEKRYF